MALGSAARPRMSCARASIRPKIMREMIKVLLAVLVPLAWFVSCGLAFGQLERHRLPGTQEPQGMLWFLDTIDASRYEPAGRKWIRVVIALQCLPIAAMLLWWLFD